MSPTAYPNFRTEVIHIADKVPPHALLEFPFNVKRKRLSDLVSLTLGGNTGHGAVIMHENARNWDSSKSSRIEGEYDRWDELRLHGCHCPSFAMAVDVSGNGCNDLVVITEYGQSLDSPVPFGGRIVWLENAGTDDGDWVSRDIGRFPGVKRVKAGHFTSTFSLQILAFAKPTAGSPKSLLIIFVRPPELYGSPHWLFKVAVGLEDAFTEVHDCLVVKDERGGGLDRLIVSSTEGLSTAWYTGQQWLHRPLIVENRDVILGTPGRLYAGTINKDKLAFFVCSSASQPGVVVFFVKHPQCCRELEATTWMVGASVSFDNGCIEDILCVDIDGDRTDEVFVSVSSSGPSSGIYMFDIQGDEVVQFKVSDDVATSIVHGRFASRTKTDIAFISNSSPTTISILQSFPILSEIRPVVGAPSAGAIALTSHLTFTVPRTPSHISEADILSLKGLTLSLVVLPPDAPFHLSSFDDGMEAVKVLHGSLGWIDQCTGGVVERTGRIIGATTTGAVDGQVTSMRVCSADGCVRSGNGGTIFIRFRTSHSHFGGDANNGLLRVLNVLPSYFPCNVREHQFSWKEAGWLPGVDHNVLGTIEALDLPGFSVHIADGPKPADIVHVQFSAATPGVTRPVSNELLIPPPLSGQSLETEIACITNVGGDGGIGAVPRGGARILPQLHECKLGDNHYQWTSRRPNRIGEPRWNVWMSFISSFTSTRDDPSCIDKHRCTIA